MYYCNEFNSLSVLSLYEGELLGKVDKLYFDKKLKKLIEIELVGEDFSKLILPTKNIYHVGKNAITVKNNQAISIKVEESHYCLSPLNAKAYSITGEYLGSVKEISFDEKFLTHKVLLDNNATLDIDRLASCGKNTMIFCNANEKVNISKFTPIKEPKKFKQEEVQVAEILPTEIESNNIVPVENNIKSQMESCEFLLGRVCVKDIFNFNNELLIKAHTIVNKKNLKEVNKYGKLRELMLYSK